MSDRNDPVSEASSAATAESGGAAPLRPFAGNRRLYRRLAIFGSLAIHLYLLAGFFIVKNFVAGELWPTTWVPIAAGVASMLFFAHFSYRWIMRLDGQYGKGSRWRLEPTTVKLPWQRHDR